MILRYAPTDIVIPAGQFWWADELGHETVDQIESESVDGSLIIEPFNLSLPRRMTLAPTGDNSGFLRLADWRVLRTWANVKDRDMEAIFSVGESFTVRFARPAFTAQPGLGFSNRDANEWWRGTINLIIQE